MTKNSLGLYIHIPFCERKCSYCDFLSAPPKDASCISRYVDALCEDIRRTAQAYGAGKVPTLETIYIGGGTPSLLSESEIRRVMCCVREVFSVTEDVECTIECNPHSAAASKFQAYREAGINRLSIGLQAIQAPLLQTLGRLHSLAEFEICFRQARAAGFQNISVDVMYGLPGQTLEQWQETLYYVRDLCPEHISAYSLIIEEGTPFYDWYKEGGRKAAELPDEDLLAEMDEMLLQLMSQWGYERYEISNFSKKGYASRHNLRYWRLVDYLGVGLGASSLVRGNSDWIKDAQEGSSLQEQSSIPSSDSVWGYRLRKESNFARYLQAPSYEEVLPVTPEDAMEEYCFLGLRMLEEGIRQAEFEALFCHRLEDVYALEMLQELEKNKLIKNTPDRITLTRRGAEVANYVMSRFLLESGQNV